LAISLDGYIAGPHGEYDWIPLDPDIDFDALFAQFDTLVMGRKTFLATLQSGSKRSMGDTDVIVFSNTLRPADYPTVSVINGDAAETVRSLKNRSGKDIWLFGGGQLFRSLVERGLVDTVEPAVVPILLGRGIPMLPPTATRTKMTLSRHQLFPKSGIMLLEYAVVS
jgi:dihydrofolate reductase